MKEDRETTKIRRFRQVILLVSSVVAAGLTSATQAQVSNFSASSLRTEAKVSLRELQIPPKARDEFERGLRRLEKRDPAGSLRHFDTAIRVFPDYYEVYYHEGIAALQLRNNEDAERYFQKSIDLSEGKYARAEFGYGLALLRQDKPEEAETAVRHGLEADPNNADGQVVLGFVLLKLNRPEEAEKKARDALTLHSANAAKGYLVLSDVDAAAGNYDQQARDLDAYLKLRPDDPNKKMLRGIRDLAKRLAARSRLTASK
jgi:tetratricopeptide (TPR) repeat protein